MKLILIWFLVIPFAVSAQVSSSQFRSISVNEGLSQNSVYCTMQDRQGFIWMGTGDGLNRFDGKKIKIFRPKENDTSGFFLPGTIINSNILEDRFDQLWFSTNKGLVKMDKKTDKFALIKEANSPALWWIAGMMPIGIDEQDTLWSSLRGRGLIAMNINTYKLKYYPLPDDFKFGNPGTAFSKGGIWMACKNGLCFYNTISHQFKSVLSLKALTGICKMPDGLIALAGENKIMSFDPASNMLKTIVLGKNVENIYWKSLCAGPKDILYAGSAGGGLAIIDLKNKSPLKRIQPGNNSSEKVDINFVNCLFFDRSENLWIGTEGNGMYVIDSKPKKFNLFPNNPEQGTDLMVKAIYQDDKKNIFIGTYSKGLYVLNPETGKADQYNFSLSPEEQSEPIYFIRADNSGRIWMNSGNRIGFLKPGTYQFEAYTTLPYQLAGSYQRLLPLSIYEIEKNTFLVGTTEGAWQIKITDKGKISVPEYFNGTNNTGGFIYAIKKGPDSSVYLGKVRGGFWRVRKNGNLFTTIDSAFLQTSVRDFYFSKKHPLVWIATDEGLAVYYPETKKYTLFDETNGMSNHYIYGILEENDTSIWFSTNKGINHASVYYASDHTIKNIKFNSYTYTDGLQSNEFNSGAFFKTQTGELIFGGVYGINWFRPDAVNKNFYTAQPAITSIVCNGKNLTTALAINYSKELYLNYDQNAIALEFAALEFTNPAANLFSYKLEGADEDCVIAGTNNAVRYANLSPGDYVFKLKVANNEGIWNTEPLLLKIKIHPPVWGTWWFRSLAVIFFLGIIIAVTKMVAQRKLKVRILRLEQQQALNRERERIGREMHDDIGAGLTQITLMSEAMKRRVKIKNQDRLDEIISTGRMLINNISEIVWNLNPENNTLKQLLAYLREQINKLLEYSSIDYKMTYPAEIPDLILSNQQKRNLLMVAKEIINNCIKHSEAKHLDISIVLKNNDLIFVLADDGKGFDVNNSKCGNGLNNMKKRIIELQGELVIESSLQDGTTFRYSVPLPATNT